tara:strand:- start:1813 stop:2901 length:1089 start_codon:yes stop_codon:yes gene_type:complete
VENFVIYTKSYAPDIESTKRLKESIDKHNIENIPFYISCPKEDIKLFKDKLGTEGYTLIPDEDIYQINQKLWLPDPTFRAGWRTQQIVKTHFNTLGITKNYLCPDADVFFINDFKKSDFMATEDTIYTIMVDAPLEHKITHDFKQQQYYNNCFYRTVRATRGMLDNTSLTKLYDYGPQPYAWSCQVWGEIQDMIKDNGMNMEEFFIHFERSTSSPHMTTPAGTPLNKITYPLDYLYFDGALPREAVLYGEYLMKYQSIDIYPTSSWFLSDGTPFSSKVAHDIYEEGGKFINKIFDPVFVKKYYLGLGFQDGRTSKVYVKEKGKWISDADGDKLNWNEKKSLEWINKLDKIPHVKYENHITRV